MKHFLRIAALLVLFAFPSGAEAVNKFAVCTVTCTWDNSNTGMWSTTTGGATGAAIPASGDAVIFDGATCVGGVTCTATVAATINASNTLLSITMGACTASTTGCIVDFSANNPNITLTSTVTAFSITGAGTRELKCGSGTFTLSAGGAFDNTTSGGSTITCGSSNFVLNASGAGSTAQAFAGGTSKIYGNLTIGPRTTGTEVNITATTALQFTSISVTGPARVAFPSGAIPITITTALTLTGNSSGLIEFGSGSSNPASPTQMVLTGVTTTASWTAFKNINVTAGSISAGNALSSFDMGGLTNISVTAPTAGGGGRGVIGG